MYRGNTNWVLNAIPLSIAITFFRFDRRPAYIRTFPSQFQKRDFIVNSHFWVLKKPLYSIQNEKGAFLLLSFCSIDKHNKNKSIKYEYNSLLNIC